VSSGSLASELPFLRVCGSHHAVGTQVGEACAPAIRRAADLAHATPRGGLSIEELLRRARAYRVATEASFPWILEELDAAASAAGVDKEALFAASIEELWASGLSQHPTANTPAGGCTDFVLAPGVTQGGHLLVGHNNDLPASLESDVIAVEWRVPDEPTVLTLGIGPWISVGWNDAGLSLTGNEVSPNDERPGIPRLLLVRAQVRARTIEEAVALATHPARASAYNTVCAHRDDGCVNVEASATASCCTGPDDTGVVVHTNHYVTEELAPFEGNPEFAVHSQRRLDRARSLIAKRPVGGFDEEHVHAILSDHENGSDSICRHPSRPGDQKTVFWCVADVTAGTVTYGKGNPCRSLPRRYAFR
jgi:isopenicillin-N N-acyltransferase like protein